MSKDEVILALNMALTEIEDEALRARVKEKLIPPQRQNRVWEWISRELGRTSWQEKMYPVWIVAIVDEHDDVGIAFGDGGFGSEGSPWGLVFLSDENTGSANSWYASLGECARESGFFE